MSNHVVIAGTGRAGTSFLVQYFDACGLETHLTSNPTAQLDENANAGLEDLPLPGYHNSPYVMKSPWLYEIVDKLVERDDITLDAVIIPIRDIVEAATSRVVLEMRARYGDENLDFNVAQWSTWARTAGGVVYSLNPLDQARVLAMGFHETVRTLVQKDVPIIFLDFPRLVNDGEYLWAKLSPILRDRINREAAIAAHAKLALPSKVRVGEELGSFQGKPSARGEKPIVFPAHDELDRLSILRELTRVREKANQLSTTSTREKNRADHLFSELTQLRSEISNLQVQLSQANEALRQVQLDAETAVSALEERLKKDHEKAQQALRDQLKSDNDLTLSMCRRKYDNRISELENMVSALHSSTSWRVTHPLRAVGRWIRIN